ncbi:hypothetical protein Ancab_017185 [Ancistrocladus abbreviatus]
MLSPPLQRPLSVLYTSQSKPTLLRKPPKLVQIHSPSLHKVHPHPPWLQSGSSKRSVITMKDRSKNRKPLQRGRNLSIEAIHTVQALKRAKKDEILLEQVFNLKLKRLLKFDMVAVLRELIRQNECSLALKVFEGVRKEYWYRPQVLLYTDMITVLAGNEMYEEIEQLFATLKNESDLQPDAEGFNALLRTLADFKITDLAMDCFQLMKALECLPDKPLFKILISYLESEGETDLAFIVREEAQNIFWSLEFLEEGE